MKVLHCLDTLAVGGAERVCVDACNLLSETNDYSVSLLLVRHGGSLKKDLNPKITTKELKFYRKTSIRGWLSLIKALYGFDIIHVHMRHTYGRVKLAAMLAGIKTPIVFHDHFGDIEHDKTVPAYLDKLFTPKYYIGVSKDLTDWAIDRLQMPQENTWTLANTIARNLPMNNTKKKRSKDLVMVSNLRKTKNIEFAIKLAKASGFSLDIYGQVIDLDYHQSLKVLTQNYPIKFITDVSDVFPYLTHYKLAIHTAKSETGPLVVMEYLKSGTTFLAFNTGEVIRQVKEEFPKLIVNNFQESNWLNAINIFIQYPIPDARLKAVFDERFGPEAYLENLNKIYHWVEAN
ncbi:MAG: hypothetical protein Sapg2KO_47240 [Saprospiraceae bacterium]